MKISKKATSIVEAIIIMLIIVSGVTGMYNIYNKSIKLSSGVKNKITAIQIATQAIEGFTNIRDTNWLLFSSDYKNCWNSLNYNISCIGNSNSGTIGIGSYIIYINNNRWKLSKKDTGNYGSGIYRDNFKIGLDNGIYSGNGGIDFKPIFTRELKILQSDTTTLKIKSIVQWIDSSSTKIRKIELEKILKNWKK